MESRAKISRDKAYVRELLIDTPHKKNPSKDITDAQKTANKQNVKKRIIDLLQKSFS